MGVTMNKDELLSLEPVLREKIMRKELGEEKNKIIDRYKLHPNDNLYWQNVQDKYPVQVYFSHKFAVKCTDIGMVFQIYRLCYAKTKYFQKNWNDYSPYMFDARRGFVESEIYNMEYIQNKKTKRIVDLRELSRIHRLQDFKDLCLYLEGNDIKYIQNI